MRSVSNRLPNNLIVACICFLGLAEFEHIIKNYIWLCPACDIRENYSIKSIEAYDHIFGEIKHQHFIDTYMGEFDDDFDFISYIIQEYSTNEEQAFVGYTKEQIMAEYASHNGHYFAC